MEKGRLTVMKNLKKNIVNCFILFVFIAIGSCITKNLYKTKEKEICEENRRIPKRRYIKVPRKTYNQNVME